MFVRGVNLLIGLWLMLSAFLWPHLRAEQANALVCGGVCALLTVLSVEAGGVRYLEIGLAAWLVASAFVLPHRLLITPIHSAVIGLVVGLLSLRRGQELPGWMMEGELGRGHA
jgi:hypothetical protein